MTLKQKIAGAELYFLGHTAASGGRKRMVEGPTTVIANAKGS